MSKCPICDAPVKPRAENPSHPFCSARCKTIDLGKWLNEEYRVPVRGGEEGEDGEDGDGDGDDEKSSPSGETPVRH
jgi:endogenous inhibitor of DNA gyrase (YacG/DUF329 family)